MKNILFICLIFMLCSCGPVYAADVELTLIVKDEHVAKVLNAFNGLADNQIKISSKELKSVIAFEYTAQQQEETQKAFAERAVKSAVMALLRLSALADDRVRYDADVGSVEPPEDDVVGDEIK